MVLFFNAFISDVTRLNFFRIERLVRVPCSSSNGELDYFKYSRVLYFLKTK